MLINPVKETHSLFYIF